MEKAAAHLLDFSQELDITLLDQIVTIAFDGHHPRRSAANEFLVSIKGISHKNSFLATEIIIRIINHTQFHYFKEHPEMWKRSAAILEQSTIEATRFYGLTVLQEAVQTRWRVIPVDQREGE